MPINLFSFYIGLLLLLISQTNYSQIIVKAPDSEKKTNWKNKNEVSFDLSEIALSNWSVGGYSSISGLLKGNFSKKYEKENITWLNELIVRYGINKQEDRELRKTDDAFEINSTFGYRNDTVSKWYYSSKFNFKTQFSNGYAYPNTDLAISALFAPAYSLIGIGAEYVNDDENLNFYLSPLTQKTTFVLDDLLANQGAFGVAKAVYDKDGNLLIKGKKFRARVGMLVTNYWKVEIFKNITYENRTSLYTDYIHNFGNIVVDWQGQLDLVVNEYVKANISINIVYDDDIKTKVERDNEQITLGPKTQLKQILGIGLVYTF